MVKLVGILLTLCFAFEAASGVCATTVEMEENSTPNSIATVIQIEQGLTAVLQQEMEIFIDYHNGVLYNHDVQTGLCTCFPLLEDAVEPDQVKDMDQNVLQHRSRLFAEIEVLKTKKDGSKLLFFGAPAHRLRTAAPPVLKVYGISFSPGQVRYKVGPINGVEQQLQAIARLNEKYYLNNPLLRQVDVLGLVPYLGGIVVEAERAGVGTRYVYELVEKGILRKHLDVLCN